MQWLMVQIQYNVATHFLGGGWGKMIFSQSSYLYLGVAYTLSCVSKGSQYETRFNATGGRVMACTEILKKVLKQNKTNSDG